MAVQVINEEHSVSTQRSLRSCTINNLYYYKTLQDEQSVKYSKLLDVTYHLVVLFFMAVEVLNVEHSLNIQGS